MSLRNRREREAVLSTQGRTWWKKCLRWGLQLLLPQDLHQDSHGGHSSQTVLSSCWDSEGMRAKLFWPKTKIFQQAVVLGRSPGAWLRFSELPCRLSLSYPRLLSSSLFSQSQTWSVGWKFSQLLLISLWITLQRSFPPRNPFCFYLCLEVCFAEERNLENLKSNQNRQSTTK